MAEPDNLDRRLPWMVFGTKSEVLQIGAMTGKPAARSEPWVLDGAAQHFQLLNEIPYKYRGGEATLSPRRGGD